MSKWAKVAIVAVLLLSVVGIYMGKNVFFSKEEDKQQTKQQAQQENQQSKGDGKTLPMLLELSTSN